MVLPYSRDKLVKWHNCAYSGRLQQRYASKIDAIMVAGSDDASAVGGYNVFNLKKLPLRKLQW